MAASSTRVLILGATGATGMELLPRLLDRGHEVAAVVRSAAKLPTRMGLQAVVGDVCKVDDLAPLLSHGVVVASCLGQRSDADATLLATSAGALVAAMHETGASRLLSISQGLLFPTRSPVIGILRWALRRHLRDSRLMEDRVRVSGLNWTIIRPPRLTNGVARGYRSEANARPPGFSMSRADLAEFIADEIEAPDYPRSIVGIASR